MWCKITAAAAAAPTAAPVIAPTADPTASALTAAAAAPAGMPFTAAAAATPSSTAAAAAGYNSLQEVMDHPFFAGIDWQAVRQAPAPKFAVQPATDRQDLSLDWELTSLFRQAAAPAVKYEYLPTGATV
jgi:hypothetical protein